MIDLSGLVWGGVCQKKRMFNNQMTMQQHMSLQDKALTCTVPECYDAVSDTDIH